MITADAPGIVESVEARDFAKITADALNSMERRVGEDITELKHDVAELKHDVAELKHDVAELKHDMHLLNVKIDVKHRVTDEKLDRGFRQIMEHTDEKLDRGFRQIMEHTDEKLDRGFRQIMEHFQ